MRLNKLRRLSDPVVKGTMSLSVMLGMTHLRSPVSRILISNGDDGAQFNFGLGPIALLKPRNGLHASKAR